MNEALNVALNRTTAFIATMLPDKGGLCVISGPAASYKTQVIHRLAGIGIANIVICDDINRCVSDQNNAKEVSAKIDEILKQAEIIDGFAVVTVQRGKNGKIVGSSILEDRAHIIISLLAKDEGIYAFVEKSIEGFSGSAFFPTKCHSNTLN